MVCSCGEERGLGEEIHGYGGGGGSGLEEEDFGKHMLTQACLELPLNCSQAEQADKWCVCYYGYWRV